MNRSLGSGNITPVARTENSHSRSAQNRIRDSEYYVRNNFGFQQSHNEPVQNQNFEEHSITLSEFETGSSISAINLQIPITNNSISNPLNNPMPINEIINSVEKDPHGLGLLDSQSNAILWYRNQCRNSPDLEKMQILRTLPISLAEKRKIIAEDFITDYNNDIRLFLEKNQKDEEEENDKLSLWKTCSIEIVLCFRFIKQLTAKNIFSIWRKKLKLIQAVFGDLAYSYFLIHRYLVWINFLNAFIFLIFIILPGFLNKKQTAVLTNAHYNQEQRFCYKQAKTSNTLNFQEIQEKNPIFFVQNEVPGEQVSFIDGLVGFVSGGGWFYDTPLFLGYYEDPVTNDNNGDYKYGIPLAVLAVNLVTTTFFFSMLAWRIYTNSDYKREIKDENMEQIKRDSILTILGNQSMRNSRGADNHGFVEIDLNSLTSQTQQDAIQGQTDNQQIKIAQSPRPNTNLKKRKIHSYNFASNSYFDTLYTTYKFKRPGQFQVRTIRQQLIGRRNEEFRHHKFLEERRKSHAIIGLWTRRILINLLILGLFGLSAYVLERVTHRFQPQSDSEIIEQLLSFIPPIIITAINFFMPFICQILVEYENYCSSVTEINITLFRYISVKSMTLLVYIYATYEKSTQKASCQGKWSDMCNFCENNPCWESYFGQTFYRVVLIGMVAQLGYQLIGTFLWRYVKETIHRKNIFAKSIKWSNFWEKIDRIVPEQHFDVAKIFMDLYYLQTAVLIGQLYSPILTVVFPFYLIIDFYIKSSVLKKNFVPDEVIYKFPKGNQFYYIILIFSLILSWITLLSTMFYFTPSKYCGPFSVTKFENTDFSRPNILFNEIDGNSSIWEHQVVARGGVTKSSFGLFFIGYLMAFVGYFLSVYLVLVVRSEKRKRFGRSK